MARKTTKQPTQVESLKHHDKRANIPTEELRDFVAEEEQKPKTILYPRDPSLDPQLVWRGKDEQDQQDLAVPAVPVYIQEKIHPQAIIENVKSCSKDFSPSQQISLFADFNGIEFEDLIDFYRHEQNWSNRMILGDSLLVMTSLAEKEGLKGKVQMIYIDPPYGSGTTAYVAEQWGRRWITCDTSRVALALARTRLMSAKFPYYILADELDPQITQMNADFDPRKLLRKSAESADIRKGFVYKRVPHITLKSIANNEEIDTIHVKWQEKLEPLRAKINKAAKQTWEEWEIPRELPEELLRNPKSTISIRSGGGCGGSGRRKSTTPSPAAPTRRFSMTIRSRITSGYA